MLKLYTRYPCVIAMGGDRASGHTTRLVAIIITMYT